MSQPVDLHGPRVAPLAGGAPRSIVVLLHGYGSNGEDLIGLVPYWRGALPHTLFVAPDAPEACPGAPGGRQWWALDGGAASRAAGVGRPAASIDRLIDRELQLHGLAEDRLALVGFSQGTMAALHVAPRRERQLAGVLGYSGLLADPQALATEVRTRPPVMLVHGDADPVVPFSAMAEAEAALTRLGLAVSTHASRGLGHGIDEAGLAWGEQFLSERLA